MGERGALLRNGEPVLLCQQRGRERYMTVCGRIGSEVGSAGENGDGACPSVKGGMPSEHRERRERTWGPWSGKGAAEQSASAQDHCSRSC